MDRRFRWLAVPACIADDHGPYIFNVINFSGNLLRIRARIESQLHKKALAILANKPHADLALVNGSLHQEPASFLRWDYVLAN